MQQTVSVPPKQAETHGSRITGVATFAKSLLEEKRKKGITAKLSKKEQAAVDMRIVELERETVYGGVNFSRTQLGELFKTYRAGTLIEFETLGPYLADYIQANGVMAMDNMTPEDAIGLRLAAVFRRWLPKARMISLYDDYNAGHLSGMDSDGLGAFSETAKRNFKQSLVKMFKVAGAVSANAKAGEEYLLVSEGSKVADAQQLIARLDTLGMIRRNGQELLFVTERPENPLYYQVRLRSRSGKWLCQTLDAACFLKDENKDIAHVVVLPEYMKQQQDMVWEILRVLHIKPEHYHNIFYDHKQSPDRVARAVEDVLSFYSRNS